jgi:hypothetical protein
MHLNKAIRNTDEFQKFKNFWVILNEKCIENYKKCIKGN